MIIIIKPLIFSEAQHISIDELKEYFKPIIYLLIPLVIVTVLVTGFLINLIFHTIPLAITFILASMIIPINSDTIKNISKNLEFLKEIFPILEGESLFNDSIAILMFDFALAFSITGLYYI